MAWVVHLGPIVPNVADNCGCEYCLKKALNTDTVGGESDEEDEEEEEDKP
uniref:Uncharacterized protein n=1 Tax=viral metagenome TaxID=1070528 RepID=A0A6M3LNN7_9ZZZZ